MRDRSDIMLLWKMVVILDCIPLVVQLLLLLLLLGLLV